jgi:hypothetical protein
MTLTAADMPPFFPPEVVEILSGTREQDFTDALNYVVRLNGDVMIHGRYTSTPGRLIMRDLGGPLACLHEPLPGAPSPVLSSGAPLRSAS